MSACLSDQDLRAFVSGSGTPEQIAHLKVTSRSFAIEIRPAILRSVD